MGSAQILTVNPPGGFSKTDILDFISLVRAGNEVGNIALERNVRNAKCLVFGRQDSCLVGVAALKNPLPSHRKKLESKTAVSLNTNELPFELGYVFVLPSARNQGLARRLCQLAFSQADGRGVFATTRVDNVAMAAILAKLGFSRTGRTYASDRGNYQLQLFVRYADP
ncbi:MAG: GNAT family N-acetyltransferase [Nitrospiraceae bacterium]